MRTLSAALLTELGLVVTRPGYLVQMNFSTTIRLSTMGDISWNGYTWVAADVALSGIGQDGTGMASGSLMLGNTDSAYGAVVLTEGASDIAVSIWACYAGATASGDPVQIFSGGMDGADIGTDKVTVALVAQKNQTLSAPRVFINKANGFNFLQPAGTKIAVNGEVFILERK